MMFLKERHFPVSPGTTLSVLCLLLYSAGFIRIETQLNNYEQRLKIVEKLMPCSEKEHKERTILASNEEVSSTYTDWETGPNRLKRSILHPTPFINSTQIRKVVEDIISSTWKVCQKKSHLSFCPRGQPGLPGRDGPKGDRGRKGRKGSKGIMGPPGRSGKQGIIGKPGIRGEKGMKGDIGPPGKPGIPGLQGIKGEPGESVSPPKVTISPEKLITSETNATSFLCSSSGNPAAQISWSKVNGSLPSGRNKVSSDGLIQITDVRLDDAGEYKCMAQNILGKDEKTASLVVQSKPKVSLPFGPTYVERGKNVTLPKCTGTALPPPVITWSRGHGGTMHSRIVVKDGQLSILNTDKRDSGLYKCSVSNDLGDDSALTHVIVFELPRFTATPPTKLDVKTRENVSVPCQATGDPEPKVTWARENNELPVGRSHVSVNGTLQIWNSKGEDSGKYTCTATSTQLLKVFSSMQLTVIQNCAPVGVAETSRIPDARLTASSIYASSYTSHNGRLNGTRGAGAWCPKTASDRTDYLQVDMGKVYSVCAVATQGKSGEWTTSYKLQLSMDSVTWNTYKEANIEKVFPGNSLWSSVVKHSLRTYFKARYVRFYPVTYQGWPCLRVEIYVLK